MNIDYMWNWETLFFETHLGWGFGGSLAFGFHCVSLSFSSLCRPGGRRPLTTNVDFVWLCTCRPGGRITSRARAQICVRWLKIVPRGDRLYFFFFVFFFFIYFFFKSEVVYTFFCRFGVMTLSFLSLIYIYILIYYKNLCTCRGVNPIPINGYWLKWLTEIGVVGWLILKIGTSNRLSSYILTASYRLVAGIRTSNQVF